MGREDWSTFVIFGEQAMTEISTLVPIRNHEIRSEGTILFGMSTEES
jgi:hypothetical protein